MAKARLAKAKGRGKRPTGGAEGELGRASLATQADADKGVTERRVVRPRTSATASQSRSGRGLGVRSRHGSLAGTWEAVPPVTGSSPRAEGESGAVGAGEQRRARRGLIMELVCELNDRRAIRGEDGESGFCAADAVLMNRIRRLLDQELPVDTALPQTPEQRDRTLLRMSMNPRTPEGTLAIVQWLLTDGTEESPAHGTAAEWVAIRDFVDAALQRRIRDATKSYRKRRRLDTRKQNGFTAVSVRQVVEAFGRDLADAYHRDPMSLPPVVVRAMGLGVL